MNSVLPLPEHLPWNDHAAYVLFDGTTLEHLPQQLRSLDPAVTATALFDVPPFAALRDISPLLVPIEQPAGPIFQFFMRQAHEESMLLLFSPQPLHDLARHLRKLLTVELPEGQTILLRLADAAVARALFDSGDQRLFGPLSWVVTADGLSADWCCQRPRGADCPDLPTPYRLSLEQNQALDRVDRRRALLDLDSHLRTHFPDFLGHSTLTERWPRLEQLAEHANALGLASQSEWLYFANIMAWLDGAPLDQHPDIARLLKTPSLQSPGERVALAAERAHRWATQRGQP